MKRVDMYFKVTKHNEHASNTRVGIFPFRNYEELVEFVGWNYCCTVANKLDNIKRLIRGLTVIIGDYYVNLVWNEQCSVTQAQYQLTEEYYDAKMDLLKLLKEAVDEVLVDFVDSLISDAKDQRFYELVDIREQLGNKNG